VPGIFPLIGDLIVRMRGYDIGPIAEQIAERLTPPQFAGKSGDEDMPPTAKAVVARAQQQVEQLQQVIQQLVQEKAAKMHEGEVRLQVAAMQEKTKLIVAQATLNRENAETILQSELDNVNTILEQMHEHATIAHQADQDRATAAHAASIAPQPTASAGSSNGTGGT
jgi:hypothetical protein